MLKPKHRNYSRVVIAYLGAVLGITFTLWAASRVAKLDSELRESYAMQSGFQGQPKGDL